MSQPIIHFEKFHQTLRLKNGFSTSPIPAKHHNYTVLIVARVNDI